MGWRRLCLLVCVTVGRRTEDGRAVNTHHLILPVLRQSASNADPTVAGDPHVIKQRRRHHHTAAFLINDLTSALVCAR